MTLFSVAKADFFQRTRAPNFWMIVLGTAFIAFLLFPATGANYTIMYFYGFRGIYNSAWVGDTMAVLNSLLLPLFSFYIIKNAIAQDRKSGVDSLLKASLLKNPNYITGKWLSNIMLLGSLVVLMNIIAILRQLSLGESYEIDLLLQLRGQVLLAFPALLMTASIAIFFESTPVLRGGLGNMAYLFVWVFVLVMQIENGYGAEPVIEQIKAAIPEAERLNQSVSIGGNPRSEILETFIWNGVVLDNRVWASIYLSTGISLGLLFFSMLIFRQKLVLGDLSQILKKKSKKQKPQQKSSYKILSNLPNFNQTFGAYQLLRGEIQLMFRSHSLYWYGGTIILWIISFTLPIENVTQILIPVTGLWGTLIISQMGCRDKKNHTEVLTGCTIYGESTRLGASWLSGAVFQFVVFLGLMTRFAIEGQVDQFQTLIIAFLFIPALAIFLGRLSLTSRTFEFAYMVIWYIGPMDHNASADFLGTTLATDGTQYATFITATIILVGMTLMMGQQDRIKRAIA